MAQAEPAQAEHHGDEDESQNARDDGGRKESRIFRLAGVDDRLKTEPAPVAGGTAGRVVTHQCSDRGERGRDPKTGKEVGQRGSRAQMEKLLSPRCAPHLEQIDVSSIG